MKYREADCETLQRTLASKGSVTASASIIYPGVLAGEGEGSWSELLVPRGGGTWIQAEK